jgi:hypothetical protein
VTSEECKVSAAVTVVLKIAFYLSVHCFLDCLKFIYLFNCLGKNLRSTTVKIRGKNCRLKVPTCRALKKLVNVDGTYLGSIVWFSFC